MKANDEFEREILGKRLKFWAKFEKIQKICIFVKFFEFFTPKSFESLVGVHHLGLKCLR